MTNEKSSNPGIAHKQEVYLQAQMGTISGTIELFHENLAVKEKKVSSVNTENL